MKQSLPGAMDRAIAAIQSADLRKAEVICRDVLKTRPRDAGALHLLGLIARQKGELKQAAAFLNKAIAIDPGEAAFHGNLSALQRNLGQPEAAAASARRALSLDPSLAEAHNNLGLALFDLDDDLLAIEAFKRALAIGPRYAEAHFNLSTALRRMERHEEALAAATTALQLRPNYLHAFVGLGDSLLALGRLKHAVEAYQHALRLDSNDARVRRKLGRALDEFGDLEGAHQQFEALTRLAPAEALNFQLLGAVQRTMGKLDAAAANLRRALELDPSLAASHQMLSNTIRFKSRDSDFEAMQRAYGKVAPGSEARMFLAFGIGKALEDIKEYAEAFGYFLEGNQIRRAGFEYDSEVAAARFEAMRRAVSRPFLEQNADRGDPDGKPIFIVGMPRSGTTLTEQIIATHPDVFGAGELPHFQLAACHMLGSNIAMDPSVLTSRQAPIDFAAIGRTYLEWLPLASRAAPRTTDKMPGNYQFLGLIKLALPNAKIVHVRRSPQDNCLSIFKNYFSADGHYYAYDLAELGHYYNLYRRQMEHWHRIMPGEIFDLQYEDLVADPETTSKALLAFCELEWTPDVLQFHTSTREIKTASFAQVRRPIYQDSVNLAQRYGAQLDTLLEALAKWRPGVDA